MDKKESSARNNLLDEIRRPNKEALKKADDVAPKKLNDRDNMLEEIRNKKNRANLTQVTVIKEEPVVEKQPAQQTLAEKLSLLSNSGDQMQRIKDARKVNASDDECSEFSD